ncbi:hypothetical protein KIW84_UN0018 [Lathyrus oleraceus]|nr:hypothetical protein KIW84_UN0018 [Pisum sativum]
MRLAMLVSDWSACLDRAIGCHRISETTALMVTHLSLPFGLHLLYIGIVCCLLTVICLSGHCTDLSDVSTVWKTCPVMWAGTCLKPSLRGNACECLLLCQAGFPGLVQRVLWLSVQRISGDDGDISFSSVYFGTPEWDLWLHISSDGCDQFRDMRTGLKDDVVYSFFDPEIGVLRDMIALITPDHVGMFRETYGGILKLVFRLTDNDKSAIHTLLQFYDPGLRCFIFPNYLLGPLMEDYASIMGIQIRDQIPFYVTKGEPDIVEISRALYLSPEMTKGGLKEKGKLPGFHLSFLEAKAKEHAVVGNWRTVCALIAVSIYGIIMFPNQKNFVDINIVRLFMQRNPIPTLVGDVYYSVHNRNEKRRGGLI